MVVANRKQEELGNKEKGKIWIVLVTHPLKLNGLEMKLRKGIEIQLKIQLENK